MTIKTVLLACLFIIGASASAWAQEQNLPRVGVLTTNPAKKRDLEAFVAGFKELGYADKKNIEIDYRSAGIDRNLLSQQVDELIRLKVSVIVADGTTAIAAASKATKTIPIVMTAGGDPLGRGLIKSYAAPGTNVTGSYSMTVGDEGKRMELLRECFPWVSRIIVLNADKNHSRLNSYIRESRGLGVKVETMEVFRYEDLEPIFEKIAASEADALITIRNVFTLNYAQEIVDFTLRNRLPSIHGSREFVELGGLMSYGVDYAIQWNHATRYVDKILKGASAAVLPLEPPQFEFLVNLRAASKMGLKIPPEIVLEAQEVVQ